MLSKCLRFCCGQCCHCFSRVWGQIIYQLEKSLHCQHWKVVLLWAWIFLSSFIYRGCEPLPLVVCVVFTKFVQMPLLHMILGYWVFLLLSLGFYVIIWKLIFVVFLFVFFLFSRLKLEEKRKELLGKLEETTKLTTSLYSQLKRWAWQALEGSIFPNTQAGPASSLVGFCCLKVNNDHSTNV